MRGSEIRRLRTVNHIFGVVAWEMDRLDGELRQYVQYAIRRHEVQYHTTRVAPHHLSDEEVAWRLDDEELN